MLRTVADPIPVTRESSEQLENSPFSVLLSIMATAFDGPMPGND
jgi:hypothetical protein